MRTATFSRRPAGPKPKRKAVWIYEPVLFDRMEVDYVKPGQEVVKTQPYGCPRNGTMGMCYVADLDGKFLGMVMENSLTRAGRTVTVAVR